MSKKFISMCLALAMLFTLGINAFAAEDAAIEVSGESASDFSGDASAGGAKTGGRTNNAKSGTSAQSNQTNTNNTITQTQDNSEAVVEQNQTKNNAMMNKELDEGVAPSRYSAARVALAPDISGTKYEEAAEILGALGIMVGDAGTGNFRPNDNILRSEMAKVSVYSIGLEDVVSGSNHQTRFPDVVSNHWANGAINVAEQQGMVIGDDIGTFRPDDPVLFQEAVTIMVRALGYEPKAMSSGGYPTGYMVVASSNQMLKGINAEAASPATRGDIAQLVFNSLTVDMMEQTGFGSNVNYEVVDKTLLYDRLNVEKAYGQITGTSETTLSGGNTTADDRITISEKSFIEGKTRAKQLLGYNVVYYARIDSNSDEKTLIAVRPQDSKNNTLTIAAKDIVSVTGEDEANKTVTYWRDSDKDTTTRTATVVAKPVYIYNGKFVDTMTAEQLKPDAGNMILLDTDVNNVYDIVFVNKFTNIVVDTVSTATGRVTDKYNNGSIVLDEKDTNVKYSIIRGGEEITTADLKEWDVISYTVSTDKELIKAYVSTDSILGTVTQITKDKYRIDNSETSYEKASNYPNEIKLRDSGRFYLDMEGKIAAVDTTASVSGSAIRGSYGYLVNAAISGSFNDVLQFRIFTANGETVILDAANKIRVNDTYGLSSTDALSALGKDGVVNSQLVTYETNSSGKLTGIDLAVDKTASGAVNKDKFTKNISAADQTYKSASNTLGRVKVTEGTIVFDIPADAGTDTARYAIRNRSMFANDTAYDIIVYDMQEDFAAKAIVVTSSTSATAAESPIVLVDEIASTQNEDFEEVDVVYGIENGEKVELMSSDKNVFYKNATTPIKQGDIFQYSTDAKGRVDAITVLFDSSKASTEFEKQVQTDLYVAYGRVTKKFSDSVNLSVNGTVRNYSTANALVYEYNSKRNNNNISIVSSGDIEIYEDGNEVRLFAKIYKDEVKELVIVR